MIPIARSTVFFLLLFSLSIQASGQLNLQIEASRTTGTAPLYVFFDATSTLGLADTNDLVNADFSWNFDQNGNDPLGNWEITKGMVAGHVFESPGNHTVACTLTAPDGTTDTETISITVSAFSGTTYYVSSTGNDSNDGLSPATSWETANYAIDQLDSNTQVLFRRGDTFLNVEGSIQFLEGPLILGAFGNGEKPRLHVDLDGDPIETILDVRNAQDVRIMDLHLIANNSVVSRGINFRDSSTHALALRLEIEQSTMHALTQANGQLLGVFDCNFHHFGALALFSGGSNQLAFVGNDLDSLIGTPQPEHGLRIQGGEKQFVAHNSLTNLIETKTAITIRGDGQRHVMVYQNKMDRILGVNPQDASTVAAISYVTLEGNYIGQNPDYTGTSWENSNNGINIEATNIAVRNNVIDGYRNAINISHDYNGVVSGTVDVYHNTINWRPVSPQSQTLGRLVNVRDVSNVNVMNNLITAPTVAEAIEVNYSGTNTNIQAGSNIISTPTEFATLPLPGSAADLNDISNYQLSDSNGLAYNAGANGIPVFYDANNDARDPGFPDVGAYEYRVLTSTITPEIIRDISIFPNPFVDYLVIENAQENWIYELRDALGKQVFRGNQTHLTEGIGQLSTGIYYLSILDPLDPSFLRTRKLIKK